MPPRICIACGLPTPGRASRHRACGGRTPPTGPRHHDSVHTRLAKQVVAEANANGTYCALCGLPPTPSDPLEGGHIIPASQGGKNIYSNYRAEHRSHNRAEGARLARKRGARFFPDR